MLGALPNFLGIRLGVVLCYVQGNEIEAIVGM
jgi:hypothetical protein